MGQGDGMIIKQKYLSKDKDGRIFSEWIRWHKTSGSNYGFYYFTTPHELKKLKALCRKEIEEVNRTTNDTEKLLDPRWWVREMVK